MTAALCTLDVAGGLNQPLRRDISAPADPVDRRDCQARDAGQRSTNASGDGSCDASLLGARSGTCDRRSHRHANAGADASGGRAQAHAEARAKVLRLLFHGRHRVCCPVAAGSRVVSSAGDVNQGPSPRKHARLVTSYRTELAKEDVGSNSTAPHYEYGIAYARRPAPRKFASFFLSRDPATPCRKSSLVPLLPTSWWFCNLSRQIWHEMIQTKIACHGNKKSHGM